MACFSPLVPVVTCALVFGSYSRVPSSSFTVPVPLLLFSTCRQVPPYYFFYFFILFLFYNGDDKIQNRHDGADDTRCRPWRECAHGIERVDIRRWGYNDARKREERLHCPWPDERACAHELFRAHKQCTLGQCLCVDVDIDNRELQSRGNLDKRRVQWKHDPPCASVARRGYPLAGDHSCGNRG